MAGVMSGDELGNNGKQRHVLVVEDDPSISLGLRMNLEAEGYLVDVADDGETGLEMAKDESLDLVILDVMLPKLNGLEVLRSLRDAGVMTPIIVLSARGAEMDKVVGLELGAEDYITKPFGLAELFARVNAVLRRVALATPRQTADSVRFGNIEIRYSSRQVFRDGQPVELTVTEFDVLWCLVKAQGDVLSREQILAQVWGPSHHGTVRTIDNFMLQIRNKLEDEPQEPKHLLTVRGVGYRLKN
jgi:DNA-binding response OmpR family regulator